uniref:Uncharacterized protein n=1 Tax=Coprothermobacter proteolyticus (strain ATCC 35245 / DSM 5265 / OCM 4 / BT) TaxID=309798 RepID=B5Y618_COPPD
MKLKERVTESIDSKKAFLAYLQGIETPFFHG